MTMWKQVLVSVVLLVGAVLVWGWYFPSMGGFLGRSGSSAASVGAPRTLGTGGGAAGGGVVVRGAAVGEGRINDAVTAIGDGRAARSVTVTPYATGHMVSIGVSAGQTVAAGAELAELDSESEQIALDRARLVLSDARASAARSEALRKSNAITDVQLRADTLASGQAELAERDAALALERRSVRAPFAGSVGIVAVDVGDQVAPGTAIVTLDDRSRILVDFQVPERILGQLGIGDKVTARPLSRPGLVIEGEVEAIDSRVNEASRMLRVQASFDNEADRLRPGMAFSISMKFPGDAFPAVDPLAIQWDSDGAYVWTAVEGKARRVPVHVIQRADDAVLVDADLRPGQVVVTEGVQRLREGAPFRFEAAVAEPGSGVDASDQGASDQGGASAAPRAN